MGAPARQAWRLPLPALFCLTSMFGAAGLQPSKRAAGRALDRPRQRLSLLSQRAPQGALPSSAGPEENRTVIHFLFLLKDTLPFQQTWEKFFSTAPPGSWSAWAHCQSFTACAQPGALGHIGVHQVPTVPSKRTDDLVSPYVQLLRFALQANEERSATLNEKFLLISDSTLPVKPFAAIHRTLSESTESDFCFNSPDQWASLRHQGHRYVLPKHWQWVVLNRSHATALVSSWKPTSSFHKWTVPLQGGGSMPRTAFAGGAQAPDEEAPWAYTEGALRDGTTSSSFMPLAMFLHRRCRTYLTFAADVAKYKNPLSPDDREATTVQLDQDKDFKWGKQGTAIYDHPMSFQRVTNRSAEILRKSSYLFARKFVKGSLPESYADIAFGPGP